MNLWLSRLRKSLTAKLLFSVSAVLFISLGLWGYFNMRFIREREIHDLAANMDRLGNTVRLGTQYAMLLNSRDDIQQIISNIAGQNEIENIRIYNKAGVIKFSNRPEELEQHTNIRNEACFVCHHSDPPSETLNKTQRVRIAASGHGYRLMSIISPIFNDVGCAAGDCHFHPEDKKVLGALYLVMSLEEIDRTIAAQRRNLFFLTALLVCATALIIIAISMRFVTKPVQYLTREAKRIEEGDYPSDVRLNQHDEMQELAHAIHQMGRAIAEKTEALNLQRDEYQNLFETVPCIITVQDQSYRLLGFNREFADKFKPLAGAFCYQAYKGRNDKCVDCPVEKTFADGLPHFSEESALDRDGTVKHWIVRTSPIKNHDGRVVAAMEMNLDITDRKQLEEKLRLSEKKYYAIFNTIPNPVFVLAPADLSILDCNDSVKTVYGYTPQDLIGMNFADLFQDPSDTTRPLEELSKHRMIERIRHRTKDGSTRDVTICLASSEFGGQHVLLATINDITKTLEAEQQLIQASKMATLGEMATGVAHELNQPLSVIKTASSYFMRKLRNGQPIEESILMTMAEEIDKHVRRATKIIGHMRQFGRKADPDLERVQLNDILHQAFDFFSQQLTVRGIEVTWNLAPGLPMIIGDAARLEQVVINLLINARDAIEERWPPAAHERTPVKRINLSTFRRENMVVLSICDTGIGIPRAIITKIFEPFFTTKSVGQGTGLGLSISYGIIKECNGEISACPNPGGGTCFVIEFPVPNAAV